MPLISLLLLLALINPDELIIQLIENASTRKKDSLEKLHKHDGPSEQTIRNKAGSDYRALLKAWADYSEGYTTKQKTNQQSTTADTILAGISDPTIRALVGVYWLKIKN